MVPKPSLAGTPVASHRVEIDADLVDRALAQARAGTGEILDYADLQQSYLILRVRGHAVSWLVKTRKATRKIGAPPKMLVREARRQAPNVLAELRIAPSERPDLVNPTSAGWTWEELRRRYKEHVESPRIKRGRARHPSKATANDVELSLNRNAFDCWLGKKINTLRPGDLVAVIQEIQKAHSQRQCEKALSYTKAALTWALSNHASDSGLQPSNPWWMLVRAPQPTQEEVENLLERQKVRSSPFTIEHLGVVLARHEDFCRGKSGNEKISPSVRWGLWWDALTANRRGAATMLLHDAVQWDDPRGQQGWGLVWWPAEIMKTRIDFWLPIPPFGLHILKCTMRDWRALVNKSHGFQNKTKWVFSSTRRTGRDPTNFDVVVAPIRYPITFATFVVSAATITEIILPNYLISPCTQSEMRLVPICLTATIFHLARHLRCSRIPLRVTMTLGTKSSHRLRANFTTSRNVFR